MRYTVEHATLAFDDAGRTQVVVVTGDQHPVEADLTGPVERQPEGTGGMTAPAA